jgi:hypothetical protein
MAKVERGAITVVSSGSKTYVLNDDTLIPTNISFSISTNSNSERSVGNYNGLINYSGNIGTYSDVSATKSICHYRNISGVKTKIAEATVTGFDEGEFYMNFTTLTENTSINFVVHGN